MSLSDFCEPLFDYVCRLNRTARKGGEAQEGAVRTEVLRILADLKAKSQTDSKLHEQFLKVELPLLFFADSLISESRLKFAAAWNKNRLAFDRKELAGDEKFFDLLDETLQDPSADATDRLQVFYTCLGLGFTGWYSGQIDYIQRKMKEIAARIGVDTSPEAKAKIVPEAYEKVDTRNLIEPPGAKLAGTAIALTGLTALLLTMNVLIYRQHLRETATALRTLVTTERLLNGEPIDEKTATSAEDPAKAIEEEDDVPLPPTRRHTGGSDGKGE